MWKLKTQTKSLSNVIRQILSKMKCPSCNQGELKKSKIREEQFGVFLGEYEGLRCNICGESFLDEKATHDILQRSKELGIFGLEATTKVTKSGNSLSIRVPKKLAEFMKLKEGKEVRMHPAGNKLIVET